MKFNAILVASALGLASASPVQKRAALEYFGINESGAEFGNTIIPGNEGKEFTFPSTSAIDTLISDGFNVFRVAFLMERLVPTLTGTINAAYLKNLTTVVDHITSKGSSAIIDPHNFGRFNGAIIEDVDGFGAWWKTVASNFKDNDKVIFDTNNEYHDMDQDLVLQLNQAAIDNIRAAGATTQPIFVEGNSYSGAWTWNTTNDNLKDLTDPNDNIIYEMHQYLDTDGSGTHEECVSSTIGAERVSGATAWLKANGKKGIIGEFAGGANDQCKTAVSGLLDHLSANTDVWTGALWWAAGPWWGDYLYSFEPPSGTGYTYYAETLKSFA